MGLQKPANHLGNPRPVRVPRAWDRLIRARMTARRAENFGQYVRGLILDDVNQSTNHPKDQHDQPATH